MTKPESQDPESARRTIGGLFFAAFGGAWLTLGAWSYFTFQVTAVSVVAGVTLCLLIFIYRRYRQQVAVHGSVPASPAEQRRSRWFQVINSGQWILILLVGNTLANTGLPQWVIPSAILIVGVHFLPLGLLFRNPSHYVTGSALILLAILYPLAAPSGATSSLGPFGAGAILWASSLWAALR